MRDLHLWRLLQHESTAGEELVPLLQQLAQLPLLERLPWLGWLPRWLEHTDATLRGAAVAALAGCATAWAFRALVPRLNDEDADVRQAALNAMKQSCAQAPERWIHVLFHPRSEVRQAALVLPDAPGPQTWTFYLLTDPACRAAALARLQHLTLQPWDVFVVLQARRAGLIERPLARALLAKMPLQDTLTQLANAGQARLYQPLEDVLKDAERHGLCRAILPLAEIGLDQLLDLFWELAADDVIDAWHAQLREQVLMHLDEAWWRALAVALLGVAMRRGCWTRHTAGLCLLLWPQFLLCQDVPGDVRRGALWLCYLLGPRYPRWSGSLLTDALQLPLARRPSRHLDLWVVGALLHVSDRVEPLRTLLEEHGEGTIVAAFLEDDAEALPLLTLQDASPKGTRYLLRLLCQARRPRVPVLLAELVRLVPADQLDFLLELHSAEVVPFCAALRQPPQHPWGRLPEKKLCQVGGYLADRLRDSDVPYWLSFFLEQAEPAADLLGMVLLARLSNLLAPEVLVQYAGALAPTSLLRWLQAVAHCPGFAYAAELQLARALQHHEHAEVRAWAWGRLPPVEVVRPPRAAAGEALPRRLTRAQVQEIASCADRNLERIVASACTVPHQGLCQALAQRGTCHPSVTVCAALLAAHDPLDEVDTALQSYGSSELRFQERLHAEAVKLWRDESVLPLQGHLWLHRWDEHCNAIQKPFKKLPEDLLTTWRYLDALRWGPLRLECWCAFARLLGQWRYHAREKYRAVCTSELGSWLIEKLTSPVGASAALVLVHFKEADVAPALVEQWAQAITPNLAIYDLDVKQVLARWLEMQGVASGPVAARPAVLAGVSDDWQSLINACSDLDQLQAWCADVQPGVAEEAALRLIELGEPGVARLAALLFSEPGPPHRVTLATTVSLWPEGAARASMRVFVCVDGPAPYIRFLVGLSLAQTGESALLPALLACVCAETSLIWFAPEDWESLCNLLGSEAVLAERLALAPQPVAYNRAVPLLASAPPTPAALQVLAAFLELGSSRQLSTRLLAADKLFAAGDARGLPLLLASGGRPQLLAAASAGTIDAVVQAALLVGNHLFKESDLLTLLQHAGDEEAREEALRLLLLEGQTMELRTEVAQLLRRGHSRTAKLRSVAEAFAWGIRTGRELTGRLFGVEMLYNEQMGYTRLQESRVYVTALPILRGERHGRDIVEGLVLHELGHHLYHRAPEAIEIWNRAHDRQLGELLNLVSDEQLERNLRAVDEGFGDRIKKLCAYAFQHSAREIPVGQLFEALQLGTTAALTAIRLGVARNHSCVLIENGRLLLELEKQGHSFARFMRALRMGLGNRHDDPKVAAGLALFKGNFRSSTMWDMHDIAEDLQRIFGEETKLLGGLGQDRVLSPYANEVESHGEGLTNDEIQREVQRVLDPNQNRRADGGGKGPGQPWLNVNPSEHFNLLTNVQKLQHDPAAHQRYAQRVQRHARRMRRYLHELGLAFAPQRFRVSGKQLDRTRLRAVVLRNDPRMLIARRIEVRTDLFLGIIIDCSGSMATNQNLEKAKLFGTLLAEAARGHPRIDLRIFGFTDHVIFDAGDVRHCAAHALQVMGGNNDAGALWYAAQVAKQSRRRAKLLVMISDGLPTECSVAALKAVVHRVTSRFKMCCAQVAVAPLAEICFPDYILLEENDLDKSVRQFGDIIARLVRKALA